MTTRLCATARMLAGSGLLWGVLAGLAFGQGIDAKALRLKQEDQQRARTMTRELVGSVLDVQLRQLEDNGLEVVASDLSFTSEGAIGDYELSATADAQPASDVADIENSCMAQFEATRDGWQE